MTYREWKKLTREEQEELLRMERKSQLEPEHKYLAVIRPRPEAEHQLDQIIIPTR